MDTRDFGKVRLGGFAPSIAPTHDASKVRLGGFAPSLPATHDAKKVVLGAAYSPVVTDSGKVKIGGGMIQF